MARNFCAILLAFGYAVLFVALSFVVVADNFYSYRDFGEFSYFSFVPFGFFAVCALAVYAALAYMRFLAPAAGPVLLGFLVFWAACFAHWGFPSGCWAQGGFPLSMRALSAAFSLAACACVALAFAAAALSRSAGRFFSGGR